MKPVIVLTMLCIVVLGQEQVFKADARLIEVYATVQDHKGRYVDGLSAQQFLIMDEGQRRDVVAFEAESAAVSCALLLDTTGSMQDALPVVKNAAVSLIGELREGDAISVYGFSTTVNLLQDFTQDRAAARRAVLRTRASGATALFDAIAQVTRDLAHRQGKKVVVMFTDGADNSSVLRAGSAIARAQKSGIEIYTVAEGDALRDPALLKQLRTIAEGSGGNFYEAKKNADISPIFHDILDHMQHTYMLTYAPPELEGSHWRKIQVAVPELKDSKIRSREGYFTQ
jgi:VWFA-related protein